MRRLLMVLALAFSAAQPVAAGDASRFLPEIAKGTGDPHAEGNDYWRRNHMEMMKHGRDLTMYNGDRAIAASLGACFDCHAVKGTDGQPVTYRNARHFCRGCHDFAAVKIDCFMCHRSTPAGFDEPAPQAAASSGGG